MSVKSIGGSSSTQSQASTNAKTVQENTAHKMSGQKDLTKQVRNGKEMHNAAIQGIKISSGEEQLIKAIDRAIKALEGPTTTFEMSVHEKTNTVMIKVLNKETGELIREIPPEKTLDLVVKMMEFAGILIDERV